MELVDAYARVIAMIEIEVEMETQVPEAEVLGEQLQGKSCYLGSKRARAVCRLGRASRGAR